MAPVEQSGLRLTLCEYASVARDGTFSILRGGIGHWSAPALPAVIDLCVLAELVPGSLATGDYPLTVSWAEASGVELSLAHGSLLVTDANRTVRFAVTVRVDARGWGPVSFRVTAGNVAGTASLDVEREIHGTRASENATPAQSST